jgi:hypothetical protein
MAFRSCKSALRCALLGGACVLVALPTIAAGGGQGRGEDSTDPTLVRAPFLTQSTNLGQPYRQIHYTTGDTDGLSRPLLDRGYLIQFERKPSEQGLPPSLFVYDSGGKLRFQAKVAVEDAAHMVIRAAAISSDGGAVMAVGSPHVGGSQYLLQLDSTGRVVRTLDTGDYITTGLCVASSGNVWTLGAVYPGDKSYSVLRNWDFDAGMMQAMLPRSGFQYSFIGAARDESQSVIRCNARTVGIFSAPNGEWIEVDLTSPDLKVKRWKLQSDSNNSGSITGLALSEEGRVYASFEAGKPEHLAQGFRGLEELTFSAETGMAAWVTIPETVTQGQIVGKFKRLLGISQGSLVYAQQENVASESDGKSSSQHLMVAWAPLSHPNK